MAIIDQSGMLEARIDQRWPGLRETFPIKQYLALLDAYPQIAPYTFVSREVRSFCHAITCRFGTGALETYHQLLLRELIARAREQLLSDAQRWPAEIVDLFADNFDRIARDLEADREPQAWYAYPKFCKKLAVCTLRLIPAGAQKLCVNGIPRRLLLETPLSQWFRALRVLSEVRGVSPLFELHTDSRDRTATARQFNRAGWNALLRRAADLLALNPRIKGLFGIAWFFDPQLERVSPNLAYVRQVTLDWGATILRLRPCNADEIRDATRLCPQRARLCAEGIYLPALYLAVWPRNRLLARRRRSGQAAMAADAAQPRRMSSRRAAAAGQEIT